MELRPVDLNFVCSRIPKDIRNILKENSGTYLAGGFIRATLAGEKVSDIDMFGPTVEAVSNLAYKLTADRKGNIHKSDNAFTVMSPPRYPVQFITRWLFDNPESLMKSFDFTICQAVIWMQEEKFRSVVSESFYPDLAARRLVYTHPLRNEDAGGSLMRAKKFIMKGYNIQVPSFAGVIARLVMGVENVGNQTEVMLTKVLCGLLREVDPLTVVDGVDFVDEHQIFVPEEDHA